MTRFPSVRSSHINETGFERENMDSLCGAAISSKTDKSQGVVRDSGLWQIGWCPHSTRVVRAWGWLATDAGNSELFLVFFKFLDLTMPGGMPATVNYSSFLQIPRIGRCRPVAKVFKMLRFWRFQEVGRQNANSLVGWLSKCIKSYILFLYRHVHLYNAPLDLKIGVLVLQASVRKWEMNILHICIISIWFSNKSSRLWCFTKVSLLRRYLGV